jgi:hypothetical protein
MRDDCIGMAPPTTTDRPRGGRTSGGKPRSGGSDAGGAGVLGNLPSTRPQHQTARRAAARARKSSPKAAGAPAATAAKTHTARARKTPLKLVEPPVPPQGFEAEEPIEQGRAVQPPSGPELAVSVAELFGELAQTGLSAGGRLLKDALRRFSGD